MMEHEARWSAEHGMQACYGPDGPVFQMESRVPES